MGTTEITAPAGTPFIDMARTFDAPASLLFRAYTEPDLLVQWMGPRKYAMVIEKWDVRDGGAWRFLNRADDGTEYAFHGVFHGTPSIDNMVQTFEFEGAPGHVSLDALTFDEHDGRTTIRTHSVFQSVEGRDAMIAGGMAEGVNDGYDRLEELLERLAVRA